MKSAIKKKIVNKVGQFNLPFNFIDPNIRRSKHIIPNQTKGWHIINLKSSKMKFKKKLNNKDLKLSPHGIFNDTLIIEYLENNWSLENWK